MARIALKFALHLIALLILYFFTVRYIIPKAYEKAITYAYNLFFNTNPPEPNPEIQNAVNNTILAEPEPDSIGAILRKQLEKEKKDGKKTPTAEEKGWTYD